jgi:hypothetical protein
MHHLHVFGGHCALVCERTPQARSVLCGSLARCLGCAQRCLQARHGVGARAHFSLRRAARPRQLLGVSFRNVGALARRLGSVLEG